MAFVSIFQMNMKFFDPEEDYQDVVTHVDVDAVRTIGDKVVATTLNQKINESEQNLLQNDACY